VLTPTDHEAGSSTRRRAPTVVCVHGVGVDARSYTAVVERLRRGGREVSAPERPAARSFEEQLVAVLGPGRPGPAHGDLVPDVERPVVWAGVSGGATLGAFALATRSDALAGAVLHEPLVGSLTPAPRRVLADRARVMAGEDPATAASRFVRELVGDATWFRLEESERRRVARQGAEVLADAAAFLAVEPDLDALGALTLPVVVTVGEHSAPIRHEAAERVARTLGWSLRIVPGAGHLAQIDAPDAFAAVVDDLIAGLPSEPTHGLAR